MEHLLSASKRHRNVFRQETDGAYCRAQIPHLQHTRGLYEAVVNLALTLMAQAQNAGNLHRLSEVTYLSLRRAVRRLNRNVRHHPVDVSRAGESFLAYFNTRSGEFPHRTVLSWDRPTPATALPPGLAASEFYDAVSDSC